MTPKQQIGIFSSDVVQALDLDIPSGTPIYIADTNIKHMKNSHPRDFEKYGKQIADIIAYPDYVSMAIL